MRSRVLIERDRKKLAGTKEEKYFGPENRKKTAKRFNNYICLPFYLLFYFRSY
jgi:hypothetical protein